MELLLKDISFPECSAKFSDFKSLETFFGSAICLDLSNVHHTDIIDLPKLKRAIDKNSQRICRGDIVLLYTGHSDRFYNTSHWEKRRTIATYSTFEFLEQLGVKNLGLDIPPSLAIPGSEVFNMVLTFSLCNIGHLVNRRFLYMGFPIAPKSRNEYFLRASVIL